MFEQKKDKSVEGPGTIVGSNVRLSGILKDANDITIHGVVEGEVASDKNISVEKNASIKGPVAAQTIIVAGKIHGEIKATQRLEILETGRVSGSISVKNLVIKSGAQFNGKCKMADQDVALEDKKTFSTKIERAEGMQKSNKTAATAKEVKKDIEDKKSLIKLDKKYELE